MELLLILKNIAPCCFLCVRIWSLLLSVTLAASSPLSSTVILFYLSMELHKAASVSLLFTPAGDSESASLSRLGRYRDDWIQLRHLLVSCVYNARDKQRSHCIKRLDLRGNGNLVAWRLEKLGPTYQSTFIWPRVVFQNGSIGLFCLGRVKKINKEKGKQSKKGENKVTLMVIVTNLNAFIIWLRCFNFNTFVMVTIYCHLRSSWRTQWRGGHVSWIGHINGRWRHVLSNGKTT